MKSNSFRIQNLIEFCTRLPDEVLEVNLPSTLVESLAKSLKQSVDEYRMRDPHISVALARSIIQLGQVSELPSIQALGHMAHGDSLGAIEMMGEAWNELKSAEALFLEAGDRVGWARTRIGLIYLATKRSAAERLEITKTLDEAYQILVDNGLHDKSLVLTSNIAISYDLLGEHELSLSTYQELLGRVLQSDETIQRLYLGMTYSNLAVTCEFLGKGEVALEYRKLARATFELHEQWDGVVREVISTTLILARQGRYNEAIKDLHHALDNSLPKNDGQKNIARRHLAEYYLILGRYEQTLQIIDTILPFFTKEHNKHEIARLHIRRALALANLYQYSEALQELVLAESYAKDLEAQVQLAKINFHRAVIYMMQGQHSKADIEATIALQEFSQSQNQFQYASVVLIKIACALNLGNRDIAMTYLDHIRQICTQEVLPAINYEALVLQAKVDLSSGDDTAAEASLLSALEIISHLQNNLTVTLRPIFLKRRTEAYNLLIDLYLKQNRVQSALTVIDHIRSQVYMTYLLDYDHLRWQSSANNLPLIEELNQLRSKYHSLSSIVGTARQPEEINEIAARIENIREKLYLSTQHMSALENRNTKVDGDTGGSLQTGELLFTYYNDEAHLYVIVSSCEQEPIVLTLGSIAIVQRLVRQFYLGINNVLSQPQDTNIAGLTKHIKKVAGKLYDILLRPIFEHNSRWIDYKYIIVPYGILHQVPFTCLFDGKFYIVQLTDITILPNSNWLTRREFPFQVGGSLILGHSDSERIPRRLSESGNVATKLETTAYLEENARAKLLQNSQGTILHIAAHAEFILSKPELSYLQLGDGRWYIDDLLQSNLAYQLVTLSACETGDAQVMPGDEVIGLGHGFLFSGSDAVIASLWRVEDEHTDNLMTKLYDGLLAGMTKSEALQQAQQALLNDEPDLHPVFWGAWQIIGNPRPIKWK